MERGEEWPLPVGDAGAVVSGEAVVGVGGVESVAAGQEVAAEVGRADSGGTGRCRPWISSSPIRP